MIAVLTSLLLTLALPGCAPAEEEAISFESTRFLMDTVVSIQLQAAPDSGVAQEEIEQLVLDAFARMEEVADATDRYDTAQESDLDRLAQAAGSGQTVSLGEDVWNILTAMAELEEQAAALDPDAAGLVNPVMGPVIDLWQTAREQNLLPSQNELEDALTLCDPAQLSVHPTIPQASLAVAGMSVDLGASAKGYAVEEAWQVIHQSGLAVEGIINAGGNIKTVGGDRSWSIGLTNPLDGSSLMGALPLGADTAIATSGDYQRKADIQGLSWHHLLSPVDGMPATYHHSTTAITSGGLDSDYYSTLLFLLPPHQALALAEAIPGLEAVLVSSDGVIRITSGLAGQVTWAEDLGGLQVEEG